MAGKVKSYVQLMRWHKPTGAILTLTPSLWAIGMATPEACLIPDPKICAIFTAGAIVARGMGCTVNDILDRDVDRKVERTKTRPIASGDLTIKEGIAALAVQSSVGLTLLCLNNAEVIKIGLCSGFMIASYPLFKRFTYWPQLMLAHTINWGVPMGWAAIKGSIFLGFGPMITIYYASVCWTLYYDTIYAHQDKKDDELIGVKSTALKLGELNKPFLFTMNVLMLSGLAEAGYHTGQIWPFYLSLIASGAIQTRHLTLLDLSKPQECEKIFNQQKYIGLLILMGILASSYMKSTGRGDPHIAKV